MGKSSAPAAPDYKGQAIATANANKYDEVSPTGSVKWSLRPGADPNNPQVGDYIRQTQLSPEQQQLYDTGIQGQLQAGLAGQAQLGELGNSQQMQDALRRRATQYYDQNFGDQENALLSRLQNQGLTEGSEAYNNELRNFRQTKNTAYADATDRAIVGADQSQNSTVQRIVQLLSAGKGQSPLSTNNNAAGADLLGAGQASYNAALGGTNANNAAAASTTSAALSSALAAYLIFSDRRLKSNVVAVGQKTGLTVYEYDIFGKRQRGYMADEVEKLYPSAVFIGPEGYKKVSYAQLGGQP